MLKVLIIGLALPLVLMGCGGLGLDSLGKVSATATLAPPATARAADTPVAIARVSDTPRAADTPTAPAVAATAKPVATSLSVLASFTPEPVATRTPYPTATPISSVGAQVERDENVARCLHWALRNMQPIEFARFERLDPYNMSDLDRVLWGSVLTDREQVQSIEAYYSQVNEDGNIEFGEDYLEWCQDYWSEALDARNVTKRNYESYLLKCVSRLLRIGWDAERGARVAFENYPDDDMSLVVVNQGVRLMNWMEMDGQALLDADVKPYEVVLRVWQSGSDGRYRSNNKAGNWPVELLPNEDKEWWGIEDLWNYDQMRYCKGYYPQLFFGRWIPLDNFGLESVLDMNEALDDVREDLLDDYDGPVPDWFYADGDRDIIIRLER